MNGIKVCVTNNGGSEWLTLPSSPAEALAVLQKIRAEDGGYHISDCEAGFDGKLDALIVGADLDVVNYLAARLSELSSSHAELLEAILEKLPNVLHGAGQVIDFTYNTAVYEIYRGVHSPEDLALYYINESGQIQMPPEWAEGIDLERFGKNLEKHEPGNYTKHGYLIATGLDWTPVFEGSGEVPSEYKITKNSAADDPAA